MTFLVTLFLIICFLYYLPKLLGPLITYILRRRVRKMFGQNAGSYKRTASREQHARQPEPPKKTPSKKIDPNVGEYVTFEEISVYSRTEESIETDASGNKHKMVLTEEQITDVEWEDIP